MKLGCARACQAVVWLGAVLMVLSCAGDPSSQGERWVLGVESADEDSSGLSPEWCDDSGASCQALVAGGAVSAPALVRTGLGAGAVLEASEGVLLLLGEQSRARVRSGHQRTIELQRGTFGFEQIEDAEPADRDEGRDHDQLADESEPAGVATAELAERTELPVLLVLGHLIELDGRRPAGVAVEVTPEDASLTVRFGRVRLRAVGGEAIELRAGETVLLELAEQADRRAAWTGDAAPVAPVQRREAPALPEDSAVEPRGIGRMTARVPGNEQQVEGVRLIAHHARVVIRDGLARTEVVEEFHNDTGRVLEGRYVFPLPPDASISRLALWVGDQLVEGEMIERRRASRIFDAIVEDSIRPRDPALLEWVAGSEFSLKIFPIMPHSSRRVLLAYNQAVPIEGRRARYVYPMSLGSDRSLSIDRFSMSVTVAERHRSIHQVEAPAFDALVKPTAQGAEVRYARESFVPARDFVVRYRVEPSEYIQPAVYVPESLGEAEPSSSEPRPLVERSAGERDAGYVALRLVAELPKDMPPPALEDRDRVIVIDRSHSQAPETLQAQTELAAGLLAAMAAGESFAVLACEAACESYPGAGMVRARPGAIQAATGWLRSLRPRGASDLAGAIRAGSSRLQGRSGAQLVVLSDGTPTAGELSAARIAERVGPVLGDGVDLRLFGLGRTVDEMVLRHLAQSLGGIYEPIAAGEPLRASLERLAVALRAPVIRSAELELPSSFMEIYPRRLPNLRLGQPLQVVAKLTAVQEGAVMLTGTLDGQPYRLAKWIGMPRFGSGHQNPLVPRLWAEARIADLQGSGDPAHREQIVALSRHHHVMSRHTALLVLENDRMYREFGVQRTQRGSSRLRGDAAWREATRGAEEFGMIGLLNSGAGGDPDGPTAPWGRDDSPKEGGVGQRAPGADRLGLDGIGEGGGGRGEGIGLGDIGTIGRGAGTGTGQGFGSAPDAANRPRQVPGGMGTVQGRGAAPGASSAATPGGQASNGPSSGAGSGSGRLGRSHRSRPPRVRMGATSVSGRLPPEVIQRIVRQNFGRFRVCYENGLRLNPDLQGRVVVRFVIGRDGMVSNVGGGGDLPDGKVVSCVTRAFYGLSFPQPEGGIVTVSYPIVFRPGDPAATRNVPTTNVWRPGRRRLVEPRLARTNTSRGRARSVRFRADVVHGSSDERWREQAEPQLERLRQRATQQQGSRRAQAELVHGLLQHGRFSEALERARGFSEMDPDHGVAHELLAHAAAAAGQGARAAQALAALVEIAPRSAELQRRVARAHEALGDGLRACAHWRAAAALEPLDRPTGKEAERCWRMLGGLLDAQGTGEIGPRPVEAEPDVAVPSGSRARLRPAAWFEAKLEGPDSDRPMILVVTPAGQVHSTWTPAGDRALPGAGVDGGRRQVGTYRAVLVGGAVDWQGTLVLRAGNRWKRFEVKRNDRPLQTIAASYVRARYWW